MANQQNLSRRVTEYPSLSSCIEYEFIFSPDARCMSHLGQNSSMNIRKLTSLELLLRINQGPVRSSWRSFYPYNYSLSRFGDLFFAVLLAIDPP